MPEKQLNPYKVYLSGLQPDKFRVFSFPGALPGRVRKIFPPQSGRLFQPTATPWDRGKIFNQRAESAG